MQREQLDDALDCYQECLRIRRQVYAYASSSCDANPIHLEVAVVLHELGTVCFALKMYSQSMKMLNEERNILERLEEQSTTHNEKFLYQAHSTNLTWSMKCAKELGDNTNADLFLHARLELKKHSIRSKEKQEPPCLNDEESNSLQEKVISCRLLARKFALEKKESNNYRGDLLAGLGELLEEIKASSSRSMKQPAIEFHDAILALLDQPGMRSPILAACDNLR